MVNQNLNFAERMLVYERPLVQCGPGITLKPRVSDAQSSCPAYLTSHWSRCRIPALQILLPTSPAAEFLPCISYYPLVPLLSCRVPALHILLHTSPASPVQSSCPAYLTTHQSRFSRTEFLLCISYYPQVPLLPYRVLALHILLPTSPAALVQSSCPAYLTTRQPRFSRTKFLPCISSYPLVPLLPYRVLALHILLPTSPAALVQSSCPAYLTTHQSRFSRTEFLPCISYYPLVPLLSYGVPALHILLPTIVPLLSYGVPALHILLSTSPAAGVQQFNDI